MGETKKDMINVNVTKDIVGPEDCLMEKGNHVVKSPLSLFIFEFMHK